MYYYMNSIDLLNEKITKNILCYLPDGGIQSFLDIESNIGPERQAYLIWLENGNSPLPWPQE